MLLADVLNVQPNSTSLPGFQTAQNLVGGLQLGAVLLCVVAVFVGAAAWAIGSHSSNYRASGGGKLAIVAGGLGALLVGFGPTLVQILFHIGQAAH